MKKESLRRRLINLFSQKWWLAAIISSLPMLIATMVTVFGPSLPIYNEFGQLRRVYFNSFVAIFILSTLFTLFKYYSETIDKNKRDNASAIYRHVMIKSIEQNSKILDKYLDIIAHNKYQQLFKLVLHPFNNKDSRVSPINSIKSLIEAMSQLLQTLFGMDGNDIGISIVYWKKDGWEYLAQQNINNDQAIGYIAADARSSFSQVKDVVGGRVFYPDKKSAAQTGKYIPNEDEKKQGISGSIYCSNISLAKNGQIYVKAVLNVTTYQHQICLDTDYYTKKKAEEIFLKLESDIKRELATEYLYGHMGLSIQLHEGYAQAQTAPPQENKGSE